MPGSHGRHNRLPKYITVAVEICGQDLEICKSQTNPAQFQERACKNFCVRTIWHGANRAEVDSPILVDTRIGTVPKNRCYYAGLAA